MDSIFSKIETLPFKKNSEVENTELISDSDSIEVLKFLRESYSSGEKKNVSGDKERSRLVKFIIFITDQLNVKYAKNG